MLRNGFTLIEIMVALAIFALVASMTSGALYRAIMIKQRLTTQSERLSQVQKILTLLTQDLDSVSRDLAGNSQMVKFTRSGIQNPMAVAKRNNQKQVTWLCNHGALVRQDINEQILIEGLEHCQLAYIKADRQQIANWSSKDRNALPIAVHLTFALKHQGTLNWLFVIPAGLYAN